MPDTQVSGIFVDAPHLANALENWHQCLECGEDFGARELKTLHYMVGPTVFSDWSGLHKLLTDCFAFMDGRIDPPSSLKRMTPDVLRRKAEEETLVVVFHGDELVACGFLREAEEAIYLGKLAVKPAFRKNGILKAMIGIAEQAARDGDKTALELETRVELVENHQAFGALGFVKTGENRHAGYDRATSITMKKSLSALRCAD